MDMQAYIESLLDLPHVKALMRRTMLDLLIYGAVMPETLEQQTRLLDMLKVKAKFDRVQRVWRP